MEIYESNNTPENEAQRILDYYMGGGWKDVKEDTLTKKDVSVAGKKGYMFTFTGRSGGGSILRQKEIYLRNDVLIYALRGYTTSGAPESTLKELETIFDSFRMTF